MSYGILPYSIEIGKVEAVFGYEDPEMKTHILSVSKERLDEMQEEDSDGTSYTDILTDYLDGEIRHADEAHKYWYVIEMLCDGFGEMMDNDEWLPADLPEYFWETDYVFPFGIEVGGEDMEFPTPDDFPVCFIVLNEDLGKVKEDAASLGLENEQLVQLQGWCDTCVNEGTDLVLFYY
jgi:hypothetical protein